MLPTELQTTLPTWALAQTTLPTELQTSWAQTGHNKSGPKTKVGPTKIVPQNMWAQILGPSFGPRNLGPKQICFCGLGLALGLALDPLRAIDIEVKSGMQLITRRRTTEWSQEWWIGRSISWERRPTCLISEGLQRVHSRSAAGLQQIYSGYTAGQQRVYLGPNGPRPLGTPGTMAWVPWPVGPMGKRPGQGGQGKMSKWAKSNRPGFILFANLTGPMDTSNACHSMHIFSSSNSTAEECRRA